jgi:hypothetical protein
VHVDVALALRDDHVGELQSTQFTDAKSRVAQEQEDRQVAGIALPLGRAQYAIDFALEERRGGASRKRNPLDVVGRELLD